MSIEAWQKALDLLPKSNLTPGELKQKGQYEAGLNAAQEAPMAMRMSDTEGTRPWDSAIAMKSDLCEHEMNMASSSVRSECMLRNCLKIFISFSADLGLGYSQCLRG